MATEIERKFTIKNNDWQSAVLKKEYYCQGYMVNTERASVRVRIAGERANLNIKSATLGIQRQEYEYPIPLADAKEMLSTLCTKPLIEKTRHFVLIDGKTWEIDVFHGDNDGLIVAEIELEYADETFTLPSWVDQDVSNDVRYYNVKLVAHPFKDW